MVLWYKNYDKSDASACYSNWLCLYVLSKYVNRIQMITKKADRLQINTKIYQYIKVMSSHDHAKISFLSFACNLAWSRKNDLSTKIRKSFDRDHGQNFIFFITLHLVINHITIYLYVSTLEFNRISSMLSFINCSLIFIKCEIN